MVRIMKNLNLKEMKFQKYDLEEMNLNIRYVTHGCYRNSYKIHQGKITKIEKRETLLFEIGYLIEIITEEGKMRYYFNNDEIDFKKFVEEQIKTEIYAKEKNKLRNGCFCIFTDEDIEIENKLRKKALEIRKQVEREKDRSLALGGYCQEDFKIDVITMPESPKVGDIIQIKIEEKYIKRGGGGSDFFFYPPILSVPENDFFKNSLFEKHFSEQVFCLKDKFVPFIYVDDVIGDDGFATITFMVTGSICNGTLYDFEIMKKCYKDGTFSKINSDYYLRSHCVDSPVYRGKSRNIKEYFIN